MSRPLQMATQLGGNALRFGWYVGVNRLVGRRAAKLGLRPAYKPQRPVPSERELLSDLLELFVADARAVRDGLYPPTLEEARDLIDIARVQRMLDDLPGVLGRRQERDAATASSVGETAELPDYYTQDFHYQTGGYLTEDSADLYDVQVETLFYGAANAMRRAGLRHVARHLEGRDQRRAALTDVACGTGQLLRQIRQAFPALALTGIDLSQPYLDKAARHMRPLRPARLIAANAEAMPLDDASQDAVTCVFLFHELPGDVRRIVAGEIARILKPGGILVFIDSLQMGDRPEWDGLIEAFPVRFHEPYYRHYALDDLDAMFTAAGLAARASEPAFLSKVMVRVKA